MTVPKRFDILRFVGGLLKILAWISLILSILSAIGVVLLPQLMNIGGLIGDNGQLALATGTGAIFTGLFVLIGGLLNFVFLYALGEFVLLQLAIEENTRLTAALLLKMHQDSQPEPAPTPAYTGGFTSEPAPYR
jgi:hypothetical protein